MGSYSVTDNDCSTVVINTSFEKATPTAHLYLQTKHFKTVAVQFVALH